MAPDAPSHAATRYGGARDLRAGMLAPFCGVDDDRVITTPDRAGPGSRPFSKRRRHSPGSAERKVLSRPRGWSAVRRTRPMFEPMNPAPPVITYMQALPYRLSGAGRAGVRPPCPR